MSVEEEEYEGIRLPTSAYSPDFPDVKGTDKMTKGVEELLKMIMFPIHDATTALTKMSPPEVGVSIMSMMNSLRDLQNLAMKSPALSPIEKRLVINLVQLMSRSYFVAALAQMNRSEGGWFMAITQKIGWARERYKMEEEGKGGGIRERLKNIF